MADYGDALDALQARLEAVLTDHKELRNPEQPEENSEQLLRKGFGIVDGPGINTFRQISCQTSIAYDMIVVITRAWRVNEHDVAGKRAVKKLLRADQKLVFDDVEKDPHLGDSTNIAKADFVGDDGIQFVFFEKDNFISLSSTIRIEVFDDLT